MVNELEGMTILVGAEVASWACQSTRLELMVGGAGSTCPSTMLELMVGGAGSTVYMACAMRVMSPHCQVVIHPLGLADVSQ